MRAVRLPPALAIYPDAWHCLVVATNASESYKHFAQRCKREARTGSSHTTHASDTTITTTSRAPSATRHAGDEVTPVSQSCNLNALPFRLHNLLASDWSQLLRLCRALTDPQKSYTFSSPGDGTPSSAQVSHAHSSSHTTHSNHAAGGGDHDKSADNAESQIANRAFLHIVERTAKDFVPNNMIYYALRRYDASDTLVPAGTPGVVCAVAQEGRGLSTDMETLTRSDTMANARNDDAVPSFSDFLRALQEGHPLPDIYNSNNNKVNDECITRVAKSSELPPSFNDRSSVAAITQRQSVTIGKTSGAEVATPGKAEALAEEQDCYALPFTCAAHEELRSFQQKYARDPLICLAEARRLSALNEQVMLHLTEKIRNASGPAAADTMHENHALDKMSCTSKADNDETRPSTFVFYPHSVEATACMPYRSRHFGVLVNLKPIVPFHLMVVPLRCVGTIHGLTADEVTDWGNTMRLTIRVLEAVRRVVRAASQEVNQTRSDAIREYDTLSSAAEALEAMDRETEMTGDVHNGGYSVAIQQGAAAGQTVAHLHTHVIPYDPQGRLAGEPEPDEEAEARRRVPRTAAEMRRETDWLRGFFERLGNTP